MIIQRKRQILLALLVMSVFFFQNCLTISRGTIEDIPVTSNPSDAMIIVDGEPIGFAPLNLKLKKRKSHIIRIEKQGYNPLEIQVTRKSSLALSVLGNLFLGGSTGGIIGGLIAKGSKEWAEAWSIYLVGVLMGLNSGVILDLLSGANFTLSPKELYVTLTEIDGKPQSNFILIDEEQFQNIKWIRIKCADSDMNKKLATVRSQNFIEWCCHSDHSAFSCSVTCARNK